MKKSSFIIAIAGASFLWLFAKYAYQWQDEQIERCAWEETHKPIISDDFRELRTDECGQLVQVK